MERGGIDVGPGIPAQNHDLAGIRREKPGSHIQHGGFPRPVGTDQPVEGSLGISRERELTVTLSWKVLTRPRMEMAA